jgi:photosystem I P700 chlorophyll a apoprotein A1
VYGSNSSGKYAGSISRKILSTGISHIGVLALWLGGMAFHGAYFSNYTAWLVDPLHILPSAQVVSSLVGQDIINSDLGGSVFRGIHITSGLFSLWRTQGIISLGALKFASFGALLMSFISLLGGYFHLHISSGGASSTLGSYTLVGAPGSSAGYSRINLYYLLVIVSLGSLLWSGHCYHVSLTSQLLLGYHVFELAQLNVPMFYNPSYGISSLTASLYDTTGAFSSSSLVAHHLTLGLTGIISSIISLLLVRTGGTRAISSRIVNDSSLVSTSSILLSINLALIGSSSIVYGHHAITINCYSYISNDYTSMLAIFTHHMWIGGILLLGAAAHSSIFLITSTPRSLSLLQLYSHRDILLGHLVWVNLFLGFHSFGLYVHNDTNQALASPGDLFSENSLQLSPILGRLLSLHEPTLFTLRLLGTKVISGPMDLCTADFLVHHIHGFTIHVTVLLMVKACLYSRSTRLVPDKATLGFRYPCDGPGRGGTCQISPWDHIFLGLFWSYNSISVVIFHFYWKISSDVYGTFSPATNTVTHASSPDFSLNSITINGWLRNFLWSKVGSLIQSYGTSLCGFTLLFIASHFVWSFSLMFLFSGRGYWQELIESILWSHTKLNLSAFIAPRALSINQGRALGVTHYLLGAIGTTWTFFHSSFYTS